MSELEEQYHHYKKAFETQISFRKFKNKGKLKVICSECGLETNVNGCTSHSKIHPCIKDDKIKMLFEYFNFYEKSAVSNQTINFDLTKRFDKLFIVVQNKKEWDELRFYIQSFEKYFKYCKVCSTPFISKTTNYCSVSCSLKDYHKIHKNTLGYYERNLKISKTRKKLKISQTAWNKGLSGEEYLKHYEKEDGSNSLYDALKLNHSFFKRSSIEIKIDKFLKENDFNYESSVFINQRQFDFLVCINDTKIIIECDGDYWHCSSRRVKNSKLQEQKRNEDREKELMVKQANGYDTIRFWEYDINNNFSLVKEFLLELKESQCIDSIINKIKMHYIKNS